jgi:hypothetical protein
VIINIKNIPIFYINLDSQTKNKNKIEKLLKKHGFTNFERFSAVKHESKNIGCNLSHKKLLEYITKENIYPSLILEDDVAIKNFRENISVPIYADCVYVGISSFGYAPETDHKKEWSLQILKVSDVNKDYHRTHNMLSSHAMIRLSKDYDLACIRQMQKVVDQPIKYHTNDVAVAMIHDKYNVYVLNEPLFYQDDPKTKKYTNFNFKEHKKIIKVK